MIDHAPHAGRLAAWLAIVAAAGVVASLGILLARDFRALLAALAGIGVAAAAGWIAVTRPAPLRVLAAVVAGLAVAGAVVGLILLGAVDGLIGLAVALAVFSLATRIAIRGSTVSQPSPTGPSKVERRPRAVLLMNPRSGGGKVGKFDLANEAKRRGVEPVLLEPGDDLSALARDAARSATVIGMAGGDGSQALVAQVAMEHGLPYVCVPAGTRNHLALDLGLDRDDVIGALDAYTAEHEHSIDLAFVNDRIFVNNVSLGIYAEIVQSDAYREAKRETVEKMLPDLLGPRATPFDLRYNGPDGVEHRGAQLILVSNNPYRLDRLAGVGSRPRLDSGTLGIVAVQIENAVQAAELLSLEALGQVRRFRGWQEWSAAAFEVASDDRVATGIDGESVMLDPPLRFRIAAAALHVRLPPTSAGLSPAALKPGLSVSTLAELWRIATGRASVSCALP
jgi:diacylglycerol kinase family enzyme